LHDGDFICLDAWFAITAGSFRTRKTNIIAQLIKLGSLNLVVINWAVKGIL
jgi:hypothetical protein